MAEFAQPMRFPVDMAKGLTPRSQRSILRQGDAFANRVIAVLTQDDKPFDASSMTVVGTFIRPRDEARIDLEGEANGNEVSVLLDEKCYEVPGAYTLDIMLVLGEKRRTILTICGEVERKGNGELVISGVVENLDEKIEELRALKAELEGVGADLEDAAAAQMAAIQQKGEATLATIPEEYSDLDAEVKSLKDHTADLDYTVNGGIKYDGNEPETVDLTSETTGYINTSGVIKSDSKYRISPTIAILRGDKVEYRIFVGATSVAPISRLNNDGTYTKILGGATSEQTGELIAEEDMNIVVSYKADRTNTMTVTHASGMSDGLVNDVVSLLQVGDGKNIPLEFTFAGYVHKSTGVFSSNSSFKCTDFIPVYPGQVLTINVNSGASSSADGVALYTQAKTYVTGWNMAALGYDKTDYTFVVPENAWYIRVSAHTSDGYDVSKARLIYRPTETIKEQAVLNHRPGYWAYAMNNVFCAGDSLTQGAYYGDGYNGAQIDLRLTYPHILKRMLNAENVRNDGHGGYTTKQYWYHFDDIPGEELAEFDTFVVWLGTNSGLTDTLDADVNSFDSYADYADTNTGAYCKIIERIKEANPTCLICLMTLFSTSGTLSVTNTVIRAIAEKYDLPVIDMSDLYNAHGGLHAGVANPHFGKAGNIFIANRIIEALGEWIDENPIRADYFVKLES